jgi:hypothetical protein
MLTDCGPKQYDGENAAVFLGLAIWQHPLAIRDDHLPNELHIRKGFGGLQGNTKT